MEGIESLIAVLAGAYVAEVCSGEAAVDCRVAGCAGS